MITDMKKILLIVFSILFLQDGLQAQNIYIDALKLRSLIDPATKKFNVADDSLEKAGGIISNYLALSSDQLSALKYGGVKNFITNTSTANDNYNPIIARYIPGSGNGSLPVSGISAAISAAGNLDVTSLADGFAKFLVKRTKEELSIAFFDRFNTLIAKDEYKDARLLFPQTSATLQAIGKEIYNYQAYLNILRESFAKDLSSLLPDLQNVINDGRYSSFFNGNPDIKAACLSSLYIGNSLMNKENPGTIIQDYDIALLGNVSNVSVKGAMQTLQLFSTSLRAGSGDDYWISRDQFKKLAGDPITLQLYLGLIYLKAADVKYQGADLRSILKASFTSGTEVKKIVDFIDGFLKHTAIVKANIHSLSTLNQDKLTFNDYYNYYNSVLDLITYASEYYMLPGLGDAYKPDDAFRKYTNLARSGGNVALDISRANYSSAIINVYGIYSFALGGYDAYLQTVAGDGSLTAIVRQAAAQQLGRFNKVQQFLLQYGSFVAAVTQAKNADEVALAIEAAALPSGSARIKREKAFNVSLNAYTGLFYGHESINDLTIKNGHWWNTFGVAAPVGVAISRGQRRLFWPFCGEGHASYSLFISVIDLGAVAAYRFRDDTTAQVPTIKLKNIFSPGLFLSVGLPKTPLSLNFGAQVGPNLRKIDNDSSARPSDDAEHRTYWRYSMSLVVDIPVVNLFSR